MPIITVKVLIDQLVSLAFPDFIQMFGPTDIGRPRGFSDILQVADTTSDQVNNIHRRAIEIFVRDNIKRFTTDRTSAIVRGINQVVINAFYFTTRGAALPKREKIPLRS